MDTREERDPAAWPPGTVLLEDFLGTESKGKLILQPRPTDDPNDPLNWPSWRKHLNFGLTCFYVLMVMVLLDAATPTWGPMNTQLGFSYGVLNDSYAAGCAALAVGALVLIPFALKFGRRPIYIVSTAIQFGISIWSAKIQTVADLMLVNVFSCGVGALAEVIVQMTIADVYFVHQRGMMNSLFIWASNIGGTLGPLAAGYITTSEGWRWVWWWTAILFALCLFAFAFAYEETKWSKPEPAAALTGDPQEVVLANEQPVTGANRSSEDISKSEERGNESKGTAKQNVSSSPDLESLHEGSADDYTVTINHDIPVKTYWQRMSIATTTPGDFSAFVHHMYQPLVILFSNPTVFYMSLSYGVTVALGDVLSTTQSTYLPQAPYNFNADQVGLMSLPSFIGTTIGSFIVGPISDWSIIYLSHRNKGVFEPEMRLWCMLPFIPLVLAGSLMAGIGLNNGSSWILIAFGMAIQKIGTSPINTVAITYMTDAYTDIIGDALVGVTFTRNVTSTIFIFALTPWINDIGIKWTLVCITLITVFVFMLVFIFIKWGKYYRVMYAPKYRYFASRQFGARKL